MQRDQQSIKAKVAREIAYLLGSTALVPLFFYLLNPDTSTDTYVRNLVISTRIGFQISFVCMVLTIGGRYLAGRFSPPFEQKLRKTVWLRALQGIVYMLIGLYLSSLAEPYISGGTFGLESFTIGAMIGGITFLLVLFYAAYRAEEKNHLELQAKSAETNMHVLKTQMQPHFLFNSLNSLSELIAADQTQASAMTQKLADLYREILETSKTPLASIKSELSIIRKYLELEQLRFGDRLKFSVNCAEDASETKVPSLVLQTLVENAVKHGISQIEAGGEISVDIADQKPGYFISITNTRGSLLKPESLNGIGIENTKARLNLLYGDQHRFQLSHEDVVTRVSFHVQDLAHV